MAILAAVCLVGVATALAAGEEPAAVPPPATGPTPSPPATPIGLPPAPPFERIRWRRARALGAPWRGRLLNGVQLPPEGRDFFTWDPVLRATPNRPWRRWGTDRLVRLVLRILRRFRADWPDAPRIGVGDLSRPRGGDFGPRFGSIGHASHQNGLDVDVYYPRLDGREKRAERVSDIDLELAQDLVDRFVAAGAQYVFVGPATGLVGPLGRVQKLRNHDDHLHMRIRARP
jgi:murein endopeptidase